MNNGNFNGDEFLSELKQLVEKHGLKECIFGATNGDKFYGFYSIDEIENESGIFARVCNAARLYQSGRENTMRYLDKTAAKIQRG